MGNFLKISTIVIFLSSGATFTEHDHFNKSQTGEYYEFDINGTGFRKVRRKISYHGKKVIKAPFKLVGRGLRAAKSGVRRGEQEVELYLSDSRSVKGKRIQLRKALADGQADPILEEYYLEQDHDAGTNCLLGIPHAGWKLFKNVVYTAGFKFPRATWRTLKSMVHGTCDCAKI